ncbi:hemolysin family protein [Sungkyunkwania multivorans]|uniref:Hemolysin family protein n=1 Tax=Sungkyunkwania multivorans TaxID=1173618 RepID=A0ABW3D318_9FLAO
MAWALSIIVISLVLSAFFSGMEIAFVSANKVHIEIEKKQEGLLSALLKILTKKPSKFIATMLVGNNIALVVYGFFMGDLLVDWFATLNPSASFFGNMLRIVITDFNLLIKTGISTLIILLTAEFLPKVFFQVYANNFLKIFALPAYIFYLLFWPISWFVIWVSDNVLRKFFKTDGDEVQLSFSKLELGDYISEQMESVEDKEKVDSEIQIFQNALEFSAVKAREVMIPRTEILAVELHETPQNLRKLFTETGYSKILIYRETIDDIIGYVHSFELFKKPKSLRSILMPVEFVPETMPVSDILNVLTKRRKSIAIVLDEYGGTSGMMTVEDIVEELFGEIEDEHDSIALLEEQLAENKFLFSARLEVDYLNETYELALPESENYETLGGFIVNHTEGIPEQGEKVIIDQFRFVMQDVSNTKINTVLLQIIPDE